MKKREGFVTNSSSSSFVIIGKKVKDYTEIDLSKAKYVALGSYLNEGQDVFEINKDMLEIMPYLDYDFTLIQYFEWLTEANGDSVKTKGNEVQIWSGEQDQHGSYTVEDLRESYKIDSDYVKELFRQGKITVDKLMEVLQ